MLTSARLTAALCTAALVAPAFAADTELDELREQLNQMQTQIQALEENTASKDSEDGIRVGGAVRFSYVYEEYNDAKKRRGGDLDFDLFRFNFDGQINGVYLSAEYRHFNYMDVIHHAWVGYDFTDTLHGQLGINQVPFGILPYGSHSYFFSGNYYTGFEDDNDFGVKFIHEDGPLNLQAAFYLNDEMGAANNSNERYSYDPLGMVKKGEDFEDALENERLRGAYDHNVTNLRGAWIFGRDTAFSTEVGVSGQYGSLVDDNGYNVGDQYAYALHLVGNYDRWNVQLQAMHYDHKVGDEYDRILVGAYAGYDTIARRGTSYTGNVAYSMPVKFGPVSNLTFYNDYTHITDKPNNLDDTWMNVTGISVTAGGVLAYFDIVNAKNQPFIGGSSGETGGKHNTRYNINVGYYF